MVGFKSEYELFPNDSHKSFYGKARVFELTDGTKFLKSYATIVACITPDGVFHRMWSGWSATTGRHVIAFAGVRKAEWDKLPVQSGREAAESYYGKA